jgi:hypothetical protein
LRLHILIEIDAADGLLLDREIAQRDRLDFDGGELGFRQFEIVAVDAGRIGIGDGGVGLGRDGEIGLRFAAEMQDAIGCESADKNHASHRRFPIFHPKIHGLGRFPAVNRGAT